MEAVSQQAAQVGVGRAQVGMVQVQQTAAADAAEALMPAQMEQGAAHRK